MTVLPILKVRFYAESTASEPVRQWLQSLPAAERKSIGADIKMVQFRWPVGLPLVRNMGNGLWEVRSHLENRIARVLFVVRDGEMILLHGFIKKTQQTPSAELALARKRLAMIRWG
jgi:phage-related protein